MPVCRANTGPREERLGHTVVHTENDNQGAPGAVVKIKNSHRMKAGHGPSCSGPSKGRLEPFERLAGVLTHVDSQHAPPPLLECLKIAEPLRPDEVAEGIVGGRHEQIIEGLIDDLEEKASVGTAFVQLSGGMEKTRTIS